MKKKKDLNESYDVQSERDAVEGVHGKVVDKIIDCEPKKIENVGRERETAKKICSKEAKKKWILICMMSDKWKYRERERAENDVNVQQFIEDEFIINEWSNPLSMAIWNWL